MKHTHVHNIRFDAGNEITFCVDGDKLTSLSSKGVIPIRELHTVLSGLLNGQAPEAAAGRRYKVKRTQRGHISGRTLLRIRKGTELPKNLTPGSDRNEGTMALLRVLKAREKMRRDELVAAAAAAAIKMDSKSINQVLSWLIWEAKVVEVAQ